MLLTLRVIQLLVRLVVPQGRVQDVLHALQAAMRSAQHARGCSFAQIYHRADRRIDCVEEWDDAGELRAQFGSKRSVRLLEVLEMAAERPVVEFRVISETHGLEYMTI